MSCMICREGVRCEIGTPKTVIENYCKNAVIAVKFSDLTETRSQRAEQR